MVETTEKLIPMRAGLVTECTFLIHREWQIASDDLAAIQQEKDDGSKAWKLTSGRQLKMATEREVRWRKLKDEILMLDGRDYDGKRVEGVYHAGN